MRRNTLNFIVDAVSLLVMFGMIATGLIIRFILPCSSSKQKPDHGHSHPWMGNAYA